MSQNVFAVPEPRKRLREGRKPEAGHGRVTCLWQFENRQRNSVLPPSRWAPVKSTLSLPHGVSRILSAASICATAARSAFNAWAMRGRISARWSGVKALGSCLVAATHRSKIAVMDSTSRS